MLHLVSRAWLRKLALGLALCVTSAFAAGEPEIVLAAKQSNLQGLTSLLSSGADVNAATGDGSTALMWAAYNNQPDAVAALLKAGADPNAVTDLGVSALWNAAINGNDEITAQLLEAGADPNLALVAGETPLMAAARGGFHQVAQLLINGGATLDNQATRGQTALMWAVANKHPEVTKVLVDAGADIHIRSDSWSEMMAVPPHGHPEYNRYIPHGGNTAMMFAAREGDLESAKILVAAGADVNDHNAWGVTALTMASHTDYRDFCEFLLEQGADPNVSGPGYTAIHNAIMHRDEELVRALLDHGADATTRLLTWTPKRRTSRDYNFAPEMVGASPYWIAAHLDEAGIMRLLIDHGADPTFVHHGEHIALDGKGGFRRVRQSTTALMAAVGMGNGSNWDRLDRSEAEAATLAAVKLAAEFSDINYKNTDGRTALDAAQRLRMPSVVEYLEEIGAESGNSKQEEFSGGIPK